MREPGEGFEPLSRSAIRRTVFWFLGFGVTWVLGTDLLVRRLVASEELRTFLETGKGWAFVGLSAVLLTMLLRRERRRGLEAKILLERLGFERELFLLSSDQAVFLTDADGRIVEVNRAAEELLGRKQRALAGERLQELVVFPGTENVQTRAGANGAAPGDAIVEREDGRRLALLSLTAQVAPDLYLVLLNDVTMERMLERRMRETERQESLARLAGGVAHDFNNLLVVILGHCDLATMRPGSPELTEEALAEIRRSCRRGMRLTEELLELYRGVEGSRVAPVDVDRFVEDLLPSARALLGDEHELSVERDPEAGRIRANPAQLERVVLNLLKNARDASPPGAPVELRTRRLQLRLGSADSTVPLAPGPYVSIGVTDRGNGLDEESRKRAFEPFYTTKEEGTGLGLAVAQGIATALGGAILVDSSPGAGSTFEIVLPSLEGNGAGESGSPR